MNDRQLDILASSVQKTNLWLKDVAYEIHIPNRHKAYAALRSVLHALRLSVPVDELAKFSAQLPLFITGVLFDGWKPRKKPVRFTRRSFLDRVQAELHGQSLEAPLAVRAVLLTLSRHVSPGELRSLRQILPREVRELWADLERELRDGRDEVIRTRAERRAPGREEERWAPPPSRRPWRPSDRYESGYYGSR
jgi:uncharacterized protein (DUF2267 family)